MGIMGLVGTVCAIYFAAPLATIVLGVVGFSPAGPVGGSVAAAWQSHIGNVSGGWMRASAVPACLG